MKDRITIEMSEVDARVLQHMADLVIHSIETRDTFDTFYRATYGNEVGYPPVPLTDLPSSHVAQACSAIAIALSAARDAARDAEHLAERHHTNDEDVHG